MYFEYGENEITYLRNKDKKLSEVIDQIGMIEREVDTDLFSAVVHHIIGQQISTKAQATIWQRMKETLGEVNAVTILSADISKLQSLGMTFRKAEYITDFARKVHEGVFDLETVAQMSDEAAIKELASLKGIGVWTAEMILLFCLQRPDIFSYDDLAIQRGLRMVYHHRKIDRKLFEKYRRIRRTGLKVYYIWGKSGTGKTSGILDAHGDENVYRVTNYKHPFDGYAGESVILFDEFRSSLPLADMLEYLDIYPVSLPSRYADKVACYETAYIVSNYPLEKQYPEVQRDCPEDWAPFMRRINGGVYEIGASSDADAPF